MHKTKPLLPLIFSFISDGNCITTESKQLLYHSFFHLQPPTSTKNEWKEESFFFFDVLFSSSFAPFHIETLLNEKVLSSNFLTIWQEHHHLYIAGVCMYVTENFIISLLPFFFHFFTTYQISNICEKGCIIDTQFVIHRHKHRIERCYKNLLHEAFMICIKNENLLEKLYWKVYFQSEHNAVMMHSTFNIQDKKHSTLNDEE